VTFGAGLAMVLFVALLGAAVWIDFKGRDDE
jgi:hypothetical protein